jgi:hypothetical protein
MDRQHLQPQFADHYQNSPSCPPYSKQDEMLSTGQATKGQGKDKKMQKLAPKSKVPEIKAHE